MVGFRRAKSRLAFSTDQVGVFAVKVATGRTHIRVHLPRALPPSTHRRTTTYIPLAPQALAVQGWHSWLHQLAPARATFTPTLLSLIRGADGRVPPRGLPGVVFKLVFMMCFYGCFILFKVFIIIAFLVCFVGKRRETRARTGQPFGVRAGAKRGWPRDNRRLLIVYRVIIGGGVGLCDLFLCMYFV